MRGFSNRFWAVTSYFNPAGYSSKRANYRIFRRMLRVPLVAVELGFGRRFELGPEDADILVQLCDGDVMWQKERLLNVAVRHLPPECDLVAWLDADILFERADWPAQAARELTRAPVCQLYRRVYHLARGVTTTNRQAYVASHESLGYAVVHGLPATVASTEANLSLVYKRGHAWCARRELLEKYELYDRCILGGGDRAFAHATLGQAEELIAYDWMPPGLAEDYRRWISAFRQAARGITYIEGEIFHLWHGDLERRQYRQRKRILADHEFDPAADLTLSQEGCWKWNSHKPEMHRKIREYFASRREDDAGVRV